MVSSENTTVVSTKGQVILPKPVRDQLQWEAGTRLLVELTAEGVMLKRAVPDFAPTRPEDVLGRLVYTGPPKSIEEMDAGITAELKARHARGRY